MNRFLHPTPRLALFAGLALVVSHALAQTAPAPASPMPDWDRLTPQQREMLIAPVRERWNSAPEQRPRMLEHARRWQQMTPEQRKRAHEGHRRFEHMSDQQREQARVLFGRMRELPPEQRRQLREQWKAMTPEQRRVWVEKNRDAAERSPAVPMPRD